MYAYKQHSQVLEEELQAVSVLLFSSPPTNRLGKEMFFHCFIATLLRHSLDHLLLVYTYCMTNMNSVKDTPSNEQPC